ncbi:MAG: lipocalin family protein [Rhodospirillales bacterium]|nr:lipocalin family protein [Rhodospirillales bacterium]MDE2319028.1 lipocalin family protein [Rhodospirillales bacterium]
MAASKGISSTLLRAAAISLPAAGIAYGAMLARRHPVGNPLVPEPLRTVSLQDYLGRWYEIARYDQTFEKGCEGVTADYSLRADGKIDIVNTCRCANGKTRASHGRAKLTPGSGGAKFRVSFFGPFYLGDYWVLDHSPDYSWSIVGEGSGRYLWILSRAPELSDIDLRVLINRAAALGYNTDLLVITKQP